MPNLSSATEISEQKQQAIDWLVRLRSDDMGDEELVSFADWLAEDHAHSDAFAEAELLFENMSLAAADASVESDKQVENLSSIQQNKEDKYSRSGGFYHWLIPPLAIAATWLFAVNLFFPQQIGWLDNWGSDYYTQTGELRDLELSDGSRVMLNTNSAISVAYNDASRIVILHQGQARFTVAKDINRPFMVEADDLRIKALGTVFQVYKNGSEELSVIVQEHAVAVNKIESDVAVVVQTGQQLNYQTNSSLLQAEDVKLRQKIAWQQQRLIINDQPLGDLIAELQRYRNGRVFLADDELKELRVTGIFSLDNPDAILDSVCKALNLKQTKVAKWWRILHR